MPRASATRPGDTQPPAPRIRWLDGLWGDAGNVGNGYAFCGNDPVNCLDPFGLPTWGCSRSSASSSEVARWTASRTSCSSASSTSTEPGRFAGAHRHDQRDPPCSSASTYGVIRMSTEMWPWP